MKMQMRMQLASSGLLGALRKGAAKVEEDDEVDQGEEASPPATSSKASTLRKGGKGKKLASTVTAETARSASSDGGVKGDSSSSNGGFIGVVYVPDTFDTTTKTLAVWCEADWSFISKKPTRLAYGVSYLFLPLTSNSWTRRDLPRLRSEEPRAVDDGSSASLRQRLRH
jgi:hypothetical protein